MGSNPPQDPDVSAVVLVERLLQTYDSVKIISCDFKLKERATLLGIDVITPGAFLQIIANVTSGQLKETFKIASNRVYKYELQYAFDQADVYQEGRKVTWIKRLMEDVTIGSPTPPRDLNQEYLNYVRKYIEGRKLPEQLPAEVLKAFSLVDPLHDTYADRLKAKSFLKQQRINEAMDLLHDILKRIHLGALVCLAKKKEELEEYIAMLYFDTLSHLEFGIGKCHLYDGDIESSFEHLIQSAIFSLLADQLEESLLIQIQLGKLYLYLKNWKAAVMQFEAVFNLSKETEDFKMPPDCLVGWALALKGEKQEEKGKKVFSDAIGLLEQDLKNAPIILENFADFIFSSGYAEWALHLYYRALEYAVETKQLKHTQKLYKKLHKSIFGTEKQFSVLSPILDTLIRLAQDLNKQDVASFFYAEKERMKKIKELVSQPFPFNTPSWKEWEFGSEVYLPLKNNLELLHVENFDSNILLLVCYCQNVGNIGILFPSKTKNNLGYVKLKLKDDEQYKIEDAPESLKKSFFLRALIKVKEINGIEFQKSHPLIEFEIFG